MTVIECDFKLRVVTSREEYADVIDFPRPYDWQVESRTEIGFIEFDALPSVEDSSPFPRDVA